MKKCTLILLLSILISSDHELIVPFDSKSEISYFGSHPAHDWVGVTSDFKGGIVCNNLNDCTIKVRIPVDSFDSGNSSRDSNMLYYVEANKFRYVSFFSNSFSINDETLTIGSSIQIEGVIDFHGIKRNASMNVLIFPQDEFLTGIADFEIRLNDHNVDRPSLLFIPISNIIEIKCNLYCQLSKFKEFVQE